MNKTKKSFNKKINIFNIETKSNDKKTLKISQNIKRKVSVIIMQMENPKIDWRFISVVKVWVSSDASIARIFISALKGIVESKKASKILNSARGFIKSELVKILKLRSIPIIEFFASDVMEYGNHINNLISQINFKQDYIL